MQPARDHVAEGEELAAAGSFGARLARVVARLTGRRRARGIGPELRRRLAGDAGLRRELRTLLDALDARGADGLLEGGLGEDPFLAEADRQLAAAQPQTCALVVIWLDELERLQTLAPEAAGRALEAFGTRLAAAVGAASPVKRLQGGAFAVFLSDPDGAEALSRRVKALTFVLGQEIDDGDGGFTPRLQAGVALLQEPGESAGHLLRSAEASARGALEAPAGEGFSYYSQEKRQAALDQFRLKQELHSAIGRDELSLHYQPVVDLSVGQVIGAEALLRWRRPDGTLIPPSRFVPLLEETALVEDVGLWILNAACRQLRVWTEEGLPELRLAVNLSTRQFRDPKLAEVIARTLELHGVAPSALEVELTETAAMQDGDRTRAVLRELHTLGVGVAIDDFGSGYSSMSYLRSLPFSKLKIDREFVSEVDRRPQSRAICKAVIELAHGLGMSILAEGAERFEEVDTLLSLGCDQFQGFYFARPIEPEAFGRLLRNEAWLARLRRLARVRATIPQLRSM